MPNEPGQHTGLLY